MSEETIATITYYLAALVFYFLQGIIGISIIFPRALISAPNRRMNWIVVLALVAVVGFGYQVSGRKGLMSDLIQLIGVFVLSLLYGFAARREAKAKQATKEIH